MKEVGSMATKSFTTDMKFSRKSVTDLLRVLENDRKPNLNKALKANRISDLSEIKNLFSRKDDK